MTVAKETQFVKHDAHAMQAFRVQCCVVDSAMQKLIAWAATVPDIDAAFDLCRNVLFANLAWLEMVDGTDAKLEALAAREAYTARPVLDTRGGA